MVEEDENRSEHSSDHEVEFKIEGDKPIVTNQPIVKNHPSINKSNLSMTKSMTRNMSRRNVPISYMNTMLESKKHSLTRTGRNGRPLQVNKMNQVFNSCSWASRGGIKDIFETMIGSPPNNRGPSKQNSASSLFCTNIVTSTMDSMVQNLGNMKVSPANKNNNKNNSSKVVSPSLQSPSYHIKSPATQSTHY